MPVTGNEAGDELLDLLEGVALLEIAVADHPVVGGGEEPRCPELSIRQRAGRIMPVPQEVGEPIAGLGGALGGGKKVFSF